MILQGVETSDWIRSTRCSTWSSHMLHEHQVLLQGGERENEFVKGQMQSELQSHNVSYRRTSHDREDQQKQITQALGIPAGTNENPDAN